MSPLAEQLVNRALAERQDQYSAEVRALLEAAYVVIADTGSFNPPIRTILAEAGLSNPAFYRHFRSKDELLLVMLDEGRQRLMEYLANRTDAASGPTERVAEWVRGVLAQASDPEAARRTRPFVIHVERLHELFPDEQEASEQQLLGQLRDLLGDDAHCAEHVYTLVFGELERHLRTDDAPNEHDIDRLIAFVLGGLGATSPLPLTP